MSRRLSRSLRSRAHQSSSLNFESLEPRRLLAGVSYDANQQIVLVEGSGQNDFVRVIEVNAQSILIAFNGVESDTFQKSDVQRVEFRGRNGDDIFRNETDVVSHAFGHAGNDSFRGGSNTDHFVGGAGNDTLFGFNGNDGLRGNDGDDLLRGGWGTDVFFAGDGADELYGDQGNDRMSGAAGNDRIFGGSGNDRIFGSAGDDDLQGEVGDDFVSGGTGNDQIRGGSGVDVLRGNAGDDWLDGGSENDRIFGDAGKDSLNGGTHNDRLDGGDDDDVIHGDAGRDQLYGRAGNDELYGGDDVDQLWGDDGDDLMYGGSGNDIMDGGSGNDRMYGWLGTDVLYGGDGQDGLFGGIGENDRLHGGAGSDRFLTWSGDVAVDAASSEGVVRFQNETSNWTEFEIRVVDRGLHKIHMRTQSSMIIRDSLDTDPVVYSKWASLNGSQAANHLSSTTVTQNGQSTTTYDREIRYAEWNERDEAYNDFVVSVAIHELGHSWDSELEITNVKPGKAGLWNRFLALSSWRNTNPNSSNYTQSGDGEWWYRNDSEFASSYARRNPREDFGTVWEVTMDADRQADRDRLASKVALVDELMAAF